MASSVSSLTPPRSPWCSGARRLASQRKPHQQRSQLRAAAAQQQQSGPAAAPAAAAQGGAAPAAAAAQQQERAPVPVTFLVGGEEVTVEAAPGQNLWEVANEAGAHITLGCSQGSCGVCEVEVWKYGAAGGAPSTGVVRACIAGVPPGFARLEVRDVPEDDIWGVDGYDT